ncbi:hypothetical protein ACEPAG_6725 [Sanghuangporus baumii]
MGRLGAFEYDRIEGVEHVIMMSVVANSDETHGLEGKELRSRISFDDGSTWRCLTPSLEDASIARIACNPNDEKTCSLHFHRPTRAKFVFNRREAEGSGISSPAPGVLIRVGSIGSHLASYEDCDTFISMSNLLGGNPRRQCGRNALLNRFWAIMERDPFRTQNHSDSALLFLDLDVRELPPHWSDSTPKQLARNRNLGFSSAEVHVLVISLDFSSLDRQEYTAEDDFEKWYLQDGESNECILGHKEWYLRRRMYRDCRISEDFHLSSIKGTEEDRPCERTDYECDANFIKQDDVCVSMIPDSIREDACLTSNRYSTPSGYRLKVGNTCDKHDGVILDEPVEKYCDPLEIPEGEEGHKIFVGPTPAETILTECPRSKWDLYTMDFAWNLAVIK